MEIIVRLHTSGNTAPSMSDVITAYPASRANEAQALILAYLADRKVFSVNYS